MKINLLGKKILFIAPIFYDYHKLIRRELESCGAEVWFFPERGYGFKFTFINNFLRTRIDVYQKKHYSNILKQSKGISFDYLFVIRGYRMSDSFLDSFRNKNPNAKIIMYQWDSEANNSFSHLIPLCDKVLSFDRRDVETYQNVEYLPLFYTEDIELLKKEFIHSEAIYDMLFVGHYLPERYQIMLEVIDFASKKNIRLKTFMYVPFKKYLKEIFKGNKLAWERINFYPLQRKKYLQLLLQSKIVFDASSTTQTGLSMRVIEAFGARKRIITTNHYIKYETVYTSNQVLCIVNNVMDDIPQFLSSEHIPKCVNYSIKNWISTIFNEQATFSDHSYSILQ